MFAQHLIYVFLFIAFVVVVWKVFGKWIVEKLAGDNGLDLEAERSSLEKKIGLLKKLKTDLENVEEEIDITSQLTEVQKELEKCEGRLRKLDEKVNGFHEG